MPWLIAIDPSCRSEYGRRILDFLISIAAQEGPRLTDQRRLAATAAVECDRIAAPSLVLQKARTLTDLS